MALDLAHEKYETRMKNTVFQKNMRDVSFFHSLGESSPKIGKFQNFFSEFIEMKWKIESKFSQTDI